MGLRLGGVLTTSKAANHQPSAKYGTIHSMKKRTILAALAASLTAALASHAAQVNPDDPGGTSFDFAAISEKRFAGAFDPQRNVLKEQIAGKTTNSVTKILQLPSTNGGLWRVSARYRMRHLTPGSARFMVQPGPARPFNILECGRDWSTLSVLADVPPGTASLKVSFIFDRKSSVEFEYKDLSLVDETPHEPVVAMGQ